MKSSELTREQLEALVSVERGCVRLLDIPEPYRMDFSRDSMASMAIYSICARLYAFSPTECLANFITYPIHFGADSRRFKAFCTYLIASSSSLTTVTMARPLPPIRPQVVSTTQLPNTSCS